MYVAFIFSILLAQSFSHANYHIPETGIAGASSSTPSLSGLPSRAPRFSSPSFIPTPINFADYNYIDTISYNNFPNTQSIPHKSPHLIDNAYKRGLDNYNYPDIFKVMAKLGQQNPDDLRQPLAELFPYDYDSGAEQQPLDEIIYPNYNLPLANKQSSKRFLYCYQLES
uniref:Secreted protein n=1 Tax=Syphacia muris TaxID=451379 RepID=A0A0N5AB15_9BILA